MADDDQTPTEPNYDFVPESFKAEDGSYDFEGFRTSYDEAVAFKSQTEEAQAALPTEADGYVFAVGEDHKLPEGFDPSVLNLGKDEQGNDIEFDVNKMVNEDDPDLPVLREAMLKHKASPELMKEIAGIEANRKIREMMEAGNKHGEEVKALGPDGQSRIDTVKRSVGAMVPAEQASALMDSITSADGLRAMEAILQKTKAPPSAAPKGIDNATASIDERLRAGLAMRKKA